MRSGKIILEYQTMHIFETLNFFPLRNNYASMFTLKKMICSFELLQNWLIQNYYLFLNYPANSELPFGIKNKISTCYKKSGFKLDRNGSRIPLRIHSTSLNSKYPLRMYGQTERLIRPESQWPQLEP